MGLEEGTGYDGMKPNILKDYVGKTVVFESKELGGNIEGTIEVVYPRNESRETKPEYYFKSEQHKIQGKLSGMKLEKGVLTGHLEYLSILKIDSITKK